MKNLSAYKKYLKEKYFYLNPILILSEEDDSYSNLIINSWKLDGNIYAFPFTTTGIIDEELYDSERKKAEKLFIEKVLEMKEKYAYVGIYIDEDYFLIKVDLGLFKKKVYDFSRDYGDFFKIFNDTEKVLIQRGEYEWEVVATC